MKNRSKNGVKMERHLGMDFLKKHKFSYGKTMILTVQGIEVGGKNQ